MNNNYNKDGGALWKAVSKNGLNYLQGNITINGQRYKIAVFQNQKKTSEKSPDYSISFSDNQGQQNQQQNYSQPPQQGYTQQPAKPPQTIPDPWATPQNAQPVNNNEMPF